VCAADESPEQSAQDAQITIASGDGELRATFAPSAGMVCCSLRHRGQELLAQGQGLGAYAERGKTMGIPLLYPWANRLAGFEYRVCGRAVSLPHDSALFARDPNGLPIHGVVPGRLPWRARRAAAGADAVHAALRWEERRLLELFPFPHRLDYEARIDGSALTIAVTVHATAEVPVPVSFGFHPYLTLPGIARERWTVEIPATERLVLDARMVPTGAREPVALAPTRLGDGSRDDAYAGVTLPARFAAGTQERAVVVEFLEGYRFAQVYAPGDAQFICFEPMTAPTNALCSGEDLPLVAPGGSFRAAFRVLVEDRR
jgi:aldose 1-epimerase